MSGGQDEFAPILPGPGGSDYERYLRTDELLSLQKGPDEWAHRDELLFQVVHQSSELWLKHAWVEVEEATRLIEARDLGGAIRLLRRACACVQLRRRLPRPPGADVAVGVPGGAARARPRLRVRLARLPRGAARVAAAPGGVPRAAPRARSSRCSRSTRSAASTRTLYQLAELLTEWDERIGVWRFRHVKMVARVIGEDVVGTQGTPVELLAGLIKSKMFPELWQCPHRADRAREAVRLSGAA